MDMMMLIVAIPVITLIVALVFQPIVQKRREREMWEHMKNARDANEAKAIADSSIDAIRSTSSCRSTGTPPTDSGISSRLPTLA
jgi:hypothetical protein